MASLASRRAAVGFLLRHAIAKFAIVRILVASRARPIVEMVGDDFRRVSRRTFGMTFVTGDREVRTRQVEARLLMLRDRESRRMESADRVA